jgi:hypothetical protein
VAVNNSEDINLSKICVNCISPECSSMCQEIKLAILEQTISPKRSIATTNILKAQIGSIATSFESEETTV